MKPNPEAMEDTKQMPTRLYRYQPFSGRTLDMIVSDTIHYSDPAAFNDPLDAKPSLDANLKNTELVEIVRALVEQRTRAEMSAAAKTMKVDGDKTINHIRRSSRREANRVIEEIEYNATNTDYDVEENKRSLLRQEIELGLLRRYDRGIVALAERFDCPLMWSHYGDEHGGICIGYSVPDNAAADTHKVIYGGGRLVRASDVSAMLSDSAVAHEQVDEAVLLRKADSWCYEREVEAYWTPWTSQFSAGVGRNHFRFEMRRFDQVHYNEGVGRQGATCRVLRDAGGIRNIRAKKIWAELPRRNVRTLSKAIPFHIGIV